MRELVKIYHDQKVGEDAVPTVNARELHAFLEVGNRFTTWIQDRIKQYEFKEGEDYIIVFLESQRNSQGGGRPRKEYYLTLDMAKQLAMVERNQKGREARQYFIACEKEMKRLQSQRPSGTALSEARALHQMLGKMLDEQERQAAKLKAHNKRIKTQGKRLQSLEHKIEGLNSDTGYVTVTAYFHRKGIRKPLSEANKLGRQAAKLAKEYGIRVGKVPDERFGRVNSYPIELLDEITQN